MVVLGGGAVSYEQGRAGACLGEELKIGAVVHLDGIVHRRAPREIPRRKHLINPGKMICRYKCASS